MRRRISVVGLASSSSHRVSASSPAGVGEQRVLAPLGHVAVVIAVVHGLGGVVRRQVVVVVVGRRLVRVVRVLGRRLAAPLAQRLLGAVGCVDVVSDAAGFSAHVEDAAVVLGAAVGQAQVVGLTGFDRVLIWNGGHVRDSGLEAVAVVAVVVAATF